MWPERFLPTPVGSFVEAVVPPTTDPADEPLVCVSFNASWLPYVLGALSQLMNPASWETPDDTALQTTLSAATELLFMVGQGGNCVTYELRFTAACGLEFSTDGGTTWTGVTDWTTYFDECVAPHLRQTSGGILQYSIDGGATWINVPGSTPPQFQLTSSCGLQYSIDGGTTWIDIPGWITNFAQCVQTNAPPTGAPPNPQGYSTADLSCAVAVYAVEEIIQGAIQKAIDSVNNNSTLLQFGVDVALLLPGFDMVAAFMEAVYLLYPLINAGNVSAFQSAMTDSTLWQDVTCAIYNAISADGKLTAANFSTMLANIAAISYTTPAVISAIHDYIQALGLAGMQQLVQPAGLASGFACGGCGSTDAGWGFIWDISGSYDSLVSWVQAPYSTFDSGGLKSVLISGDQILMANKTFTAHVIDGWQVTYNRVYIASNGSTSELVASLAGTNVRVTGVDTGAGSHVVESDVLTSCDKLFLELDTSQTGQAGDTQVTKIWVWGKGTCPFGTPNYHYPP